MNECDTNSGGCDHTCVNKDGSFECKCDDGYILGNDSKSCSGNIVCHSVLPILTKSYLLTSIGYGN